MMMRKNPRAAEKSAQYDVPPRRIRGAAANKSGETIPSKFLSSKTSHRSRPRIAIDDPSRATG